MIESAEMLGRIGNPKKPALSLDMLQDLREKILRDGSDKDKLHEKLQGMKEAFQDRGDVKQWSNEVLDQIDKCFIEHFMDSEQLLPVAFTPGNVEGINRFLKYYDQVDNILRVSRGKVPEYAREYFAYFSMWEVQGFAFPMPLGTRSVIHCVNMLLTDYERGFKEVSYYLISGNGPRIGFNPIRGLRALSI
jgi:hypothetical protein